MGPIEHFMERFAKYRLSSMANRARRANVSVEFGKAAVRAVFLSMASPLQPRLLMTDAEVEAWRAEAHASRAAEMTEALERVRPGEFIGTLFGVSLHVTDQVEKVVFE